MGMASVIQTKMQPGRRVRVLVIDDSVVTRRFIADSLEGDPQIEVVGIAANGSIALQRIAQLNPDVLTLDVEMPVMNGIETLRRVRAEYPEMRVIMCSIFTEDGAAITSKALALGANDYVTKRGGAGNAAASRDAFRAELAPKIKQFFSLESVNQSIRHGPL